MEELRLEPQARPRRRIFRNNEYVYYQRLDGTAAFASARRWPLQFQPVVIPGTLLQIVDNLALFEDGVLSAIAPDGKLTRLTYAPAIAWLLATQVALGRDGSVYEILLTHKAVRKVDWLDEELTLQRLGVSRVLEDGQVMSYKVIREPEKVVEVPGAVAAITDNRGLSLLLEDGRFYARVAKDEALRLVEFFSPLHEQVLPRYMTLFHRKSLSVPVSDKLYVEVELRTGLGNVLDCLAVSRYRTWLVVTDSEERFCVVDPLEGGRSICYVS